MRADGSYQIFPCHETLVEIKSEKENKRNTSANQIGKDKRTRPLSGQDLVGLDALEGVERHDINAGP